MLYRKVHHPCFEVLWVHLTRPFSSVGIDFCGPLFVKVGRNEMKKYYVALFTRSTTRALHLELVSDLSVATFVLCMRRFVARRGKPLIITTDNAKAVKAMKKWLKRIFASMTCSHTWKKMASRGSSTWKRLYGGEDFMRD